MSLLQKIDVYQAGANRPIVGAPNMALFLFLSVSCLRLWSSMRSSCRHPAKFPWSVPNAPVPTRRP